MKLLFHARKADPLLASSSNSSLGPFIWSRRDARRTRLAEGVVGVAEYRTARRNGTSSSYTSRLGPSRSIIRPVHDTARSRSGRARRTVRHAPRRGYYKFSGSKRGLGSHVEKGRGREGERGGGLRTQIIVWNKYHHEEGRGQACLSHIKDAGVLSALGRAAYPLLRRAGMHIRGPPRA